LVGQRLGDYYLRELLGAGGMADVYRAYDTNLLREVAVKVLSGPLAQDAAYVDHFRTEARRVAALSHPHLVPVYRAGEETVDGQHLLFLVMPLLHGSLHDLLKREGRLPYAEAVWLVLQVAEGLEAAHRFGLVHRDVKPENILLDAEAQALLADFGVAQDLRHTDTEGAWAGLAVGTPEFMAPEQLRGEEIDQRTDIYALGAVLYDLLSGRLPFSGETPYEIAAQVLRGALRPPSAFEPNIPVELEQVVLTALARDPNARYPNMTEFMLALRWAVSQQAEQSAAFASATTLTPSAPIWTPLPSEIPGEKRSRRQLVMLALAAAILVASLGGVFAAIQHGGNTSALGSGIASGLPSASFTSLPTLPIEQPSPTDASGSAVPTAATTPRPTGAPPAPATATPGNTATPKPVKPLTIAPTPLVLTKHDKTCTGTQAIRNNTDQMVGWWWQKPAQPGFHVQIDGRPAVGWPTATTYAQPGGQNALWVTSDCKTTFATIVVNDSLGNQYTFSMTVSG
jgi:serine/threonine-protein kinase